MTGTRLFTLAVLAFCASGAEVRAQVTTWESPPVTSQLEADEIVIPVGAGAIFCPVMTVPESEPPYGVISADNGMVESLMGSRTVVAPGVYSVVLGSGSRDQTMKRRVRVEEGATTVLKVDWSGLVVDVINEARASIRESYEILDLRTGVSYGIGLGVGEGLDERPRTWILPPGAYKLVKPGDNINAIVNFGTIRLLPGELVYTNLVLDSESGNFIGFGQISDFRQLHGRRKKWSSRNELSGSMALNYTSSETGGEEDVSFTASVQFLTDGRFESGRHVLPVWVNIEEGLSVTRGRSLQKYTDRAELKLTYLYKLRDRFNPYLRGAYESRFFTTYYRFSEPTDYIQEGAAGDSLGVVPGAGDIRLADPLSPIYVKHGIGISSILVKTIPANLSLRTGYGARQTHVRGARVYNPESRRLSAMQAVDVTGVEMLLMGDLRIGRHVLCSSEFDLLMPERDPDRWVYDSQSRIRINLTRHVNLLFQFDIRKDESVDQIQKRYQSLLRFSKYL